MIATTTTTSELLQAKTELWCHTFAYLKSMAPQSVIKLRIPSAIHHLGGGRLPSSLAGRAAAASIAGGGGPRSPSRPSHSFLPLLSPPPLL
jgi:hypothetical protein